MKRILIASLAFVLAACGLDKADQFRNGVAKADQVKINLPASATSQQGLEGDTAEFYVLTRVVTGVINGGTLIVLGLVKAITDHEPTTIKDNTAVWGPWTDSLSPNTYKLTVTKGADHNYSYQLEGKGKNDPDSAYVIVLSGSHKPALDAKGNELKDLGTGSFLLDWDAMAKLPEHGKEVGSAQFDYSHVDAAKDGTLTVAFRKVMDEETKTLIDADYKYVSHPGNGGAFEFKVTKNMDKDATRTKLEVSTINSRWQQDGAGRTDVKATGGDLVDSVLAASQCWDSNFKSRFLVVPWDSAQNYGSESVCAFKTAEYSTLALK